MGGLKLSATALILLAALTLPAGRAGAGGWHPLKAVAHWVGGGVRSFFAPTIDYAANQFNAAADQAMGKADTIAGARLAQADGILAERLKQADGIMQHELKALDESLEQKIGAVDVIGTRQMANLERASTEVVRYLAEVTFCVGALLLLLAPATRALLVPAAPRTGLAKYAFVALPAAFIVCAAALVALSYVAAPNAMLRLIVLRKTMLASYASCLNAGDLDGAVFYASRLQALDPDDPSGRLSFQLAGLQRDLLTRPAMVRAPQPALDLYARSGRLSAALGDAANSGDPTKIQDLDFVNIEVDATNAMIEWQIADTDGEEADAACHALDALSGYARLRSDPGRRVVNSPFVWMAYGYVKWAKLKHPWSKCSRLAQVAIAKASAGSHEQHATRTIVEYASEDGVRAVIDDFDRAVCVQRALNPLSGATDGTAEGADVGCAPPLSAGGEARGHADAARSAKAVAEINPAVETIVLFNDAALTFYRDASPAYADLVFASAQLAAQAPPASGQPSTMQELAVNKKAAGDRIKAAWTKFMAGLGRRALIVGHPLVYGLAGVPVAIVERARLLEMQEVDKAPVFDKGACQALYLNGQAKNVEYDAVGNVSFAPETIKRQEGDYLQVPFGLLGGAYLDMFCTEQDAADRGFRNFEATLLAALRGSVVQRDRNQKFGAVWTDVNMDKLLLSKSPYSFKALANATLACIDRASDNNPAFRPCAGKGDPVPLSRWIGQLPKNEPAGAVGTATAGGPTPAREDKQGGVPGAVSDDDSALVRFAMVR